MFNWFRKNKEPIEFSDNDAAFAHACTLGYQPLIGALIPALVLEPGGPGPDGERTFQINLAVDGGGRTIWSSTLRETKGYPKEGDLVGFRIVMIASDLPEQANLIGYLACRLEPVLVPGKGWRTAQIYTPDNLKPALRL
ncbi:hypothetical protein GMLC_23450 [Geomonas limicola]|uniref:Uncharacterized protein n=1 Tax=Geomonas limicola TaxID=2740186 RepID=A0A6V8N865_9BACT|nr:hypothetical protein [Geomonas limicola]GFO68766.1 hypothetical protein GMLC_23450 [Geomonas limicola]